MPLTRRALLPFLLVVLQLFAPLLHAHSGRLPSHFGLHIPGLESLDKGSDGAYADQVRLSMSDAGDCVVSVDQGIREPRSSQIDDMPFDRCLMLLSLVFTPKAGFFQGNRDSSPILPPSRIHPFSQPPRAPPAV